MKSERCEGLNRDQLVQIGGLKLNSCENFVRKREIEAHVDFEPE